MTMLDRMEKVKDNAEAAAVKRELGRLDEWRARKSDTYRLSVQLPCYYYYHYFSSDTALHVLRVYIIQPVAHWC